MKTNQNIISNKTNVVTEEQSVLQKYNRTLFFYTLSLVIPWICWGIAAYFSRLPGQNKPVLIFQAVLSMTGLIAPIAVAAYLFLQDKSLLKDVKSRFFNFKQVPIIYALASVFLLFASIVVAQLISLDFGHSLEQFEITGRPSFTSALISPWIILILAPILEELAWHTYGTDTLRRKYNLFSTSIIFSIYWVIWHVPLSFIQGYYHNNIVTEGWIYYLNFVVSLFVFVILMNWLYFKTNRNILVPIVFHLSANIANEMFATHPDSKFIQTGLLLIVCIFVLVKERKLFFEK